MVVELGVLCGSVEVDLFSLVCPAVGNCSRVVFATHQQQSSDVDVVSLW